ncbi:MAG: serine hydrolase [Phaeodactylibacter sp.]|uniref:serine hydrolase domain-containing protein n=1 Tax=Phaeodactylibacter sp. TaxID=1940289 RepID=UPI0032ED309D
MVFLASGCHIGRFFLWNFADVNDYKKFPSTSIEAPEAPFTFHYAPDSIQQKLAETQLTADDEAYTLPGYVGEYGKSLAFLIIRNDTILYETYFDGYAAEGPPHPSFSVAKSFVSALVGFAVQEGAIESVDDPVTRYLPELTARDPRFNRLTIEHLLDMRSGLDYNENSYFNPFAPVARDYYGRQLEKYTLERSEFAAEPDTYREYQSVNTQLLGLIVERATGKTLPAYLEEKIWLPLGMEFPASWSYDSKKSKTTKAFCCLNAQARDYAKFGRLYLNGGQWQGKQLLNAEWVKRSTQPEYDNNCYQYQWYSSTYWAYAPDSTAAAAAAPEGIGVTPYKDGQYAFKKCGPDFMAIGILGQYIYVHPEKNLIMVRLGKDDKVGYRQLFRALSQKL